MTNETQLAADVEALAELGIEAQYLSPYHIRFEGVLDVWPKNKKFHDIRRNTRGQYKDLVSFCRKFFTVGVNVDVPVICPKCKLHFLHTLPRP